MAEQGSIFSNPALQTIAALALATGTSGGSPFRQKAGAATRTQFPGELSDTMQRLVARLILARMSAGPPPSFKQFVGGAPIPQYRDPELEAQLRGVSGRPGTTTSRERTRGRPAGPSDFQTIATLLGLLFPQIVSGGNQSGGLADLFGGAPTPQPTNLNQFGISPNVAPWSGVPDFNQTPASEFTFESPGTATDSWVPSFLQSLLGQNWGAG